MAKKMKILFDFFFATIQSQQRVHHRQGPQPIGQPAGRQGHKAVHCGRTRPKIGAEAEGGTLIEEHFRKI